MGRSGLGLIAAALLAGAAGAAVAEEGSQDRQGTKAKQDRGAAERDNEILQNDLRGAQRRDVGPRDADLGATWEEGVPDARTREIGPTEPLAPERRAGAVQPGEERRAAQQQGVGASEQIDRREPRDTGSSSAAPERESAAHGDCTCDHEGHHHEK